MDNEIKKIKDLISEHEIQKALEQLEVVFKNREIIKEVILHKSRHKGLLKDNRSGIVSYSETSIEKNKIVKAILDLVDDLEYVQESSKLRQWIYFHTVQFRAILGGFILVVVCLAAYLLSDNSRRQAIEELDQEISSRIKQIDPFTWYKKYSETDISTDLAQRLWGVPSGDDAKHEQFKNENLGSLMYKLKKLVRADEKESIKFALKVLENIQNGYEGGVLQEDPHKIGPFYNEVINMNSYRWVNMNGLDSTVSRSLAIKVLMNPSRKF